MVLQDDSKTCYDGWFGDSGPRNSQEAELEEAELTMGRFAMGMIMGCLRNDYTKWCSQYTKGEFREFRDAWLAVAWTFAEEGQWMLLL